MENGDQPLHRPVSITGAVDGDRGHCQDSASAKLPRPRLGVSLEVTDDPCRDRWGEEDCIDVRLGDIVEATSYLRDRNVAAPCCIAAVTVVLGGGGDFPTGDGGGSSSRGISLIIDYQSPTSGKISTTMDLWSADQTKASFFRLMVHWIQVDQSKKWNIKSHVIAFQAISGAHTGDNISRYFVGLCDHVGVISQAQSISKVTRHLRCLSCLM